MNNIEDISCNEEQYITEEDVKTIITKCGYASDTTTIENYAVHYASDKMMGFLSDYLKLQISVTSNHERKLLNFFVKAMCKTNAGKANMVKDMGLFEKEVTFYDIIKRNMSVPGLKPWSARFIICLEDAVIFEDLSALQYKMRSRHEKFDKHHTFQALQSLARFHASTIIFEELKTIELQRPYRINEQYEEHLDKGGYVETDPWFVQCRTGALEAVKAFSKYNQNKDAMKIIDERWSAVFNSALSLCDASSEHRNVICHRDLWNNNILFHYKRLEDKSVEPDDCVFVDFAAVRAMPPAGDVMQILHCNLSPRYRIDNLNTFLNYYYDELKAILGDNNVDIQHIMTRDKFMLSAKQQDLWGLVSHACLVQAFWLDDNQMMSIFGDSATFAEIMTNDKATYIKNMMQNNDDYKKIVMDVFEEFIEHYIINDH